MWFTTKHLLSSRVDMKKRVRVEISEMSLITASQKILYFGDCTQMLLQTSAKQSFSNETYTALWHFVGAVWRHASSGQITHCTQLCLDAQPSTTSPHFSSPLAHNPSLQPSLFPSQPTPPLHKTAETVVFKQDSLLLLCTETKGDQRVGHLNPHIANGHPRNASSLWVWATANHVASQCHRGSETEERQSTLLSFFFFSLLPEEQKAAFCSHSGSTS